MVAREQSVSVAEQRTLSSPDVSCVRCSRVFVLPVPGETWTDRWLGWVSILPFRCQVCNARFRTRLAEPPHERGWGQRQYLRLPIQLPALIQFHDGTTSTARVLDLSIGGCEIRSERTVERGATFTIQLSGLLYYAGKIDAEVTVVHTSRPQRAGLKFIRLSDQKREELGRALYIAWSIGSHS